MHGLAPFLFVWKRNSMAGNKAKQDKASPDCGACTHYYITYDASFPYGCRALGFKGKRKPCRDVLDASGAPCLVFQQRRKGGVAS